MGNKDVESWAKLPEHNTMSWGKNNWRQDIKLKSSWSSLAKWMFWLTTQHHDNQQKHNKSQPLTKPRFLLLSCFGSSHMHWLRLSVCLSYLDPQTTYSQASLPWHPLNFFQKLGRHIANIQTGFPCQQAKHRPIALNITSCLSFLSKMFKSC